MPLWNRARMEALILQQAAEGGQLRAMVERLESEKSVLQAERDEARRERDALRIQLAEVRQQHADLKRHVSGLLVAIQNSDERLRRLLRREYGAASERACSDQQYIQEVLSALQELEFGSSTTGDQIVVLTPGAATAVVPALASSEATPSSEAAPSTETEPSRVATVAALPADAPVPPKGLGRRRPANAGGRNPLPDDIERRETTYTAPADHPYLRNVTKVTHIGTTAIERWMVGKLDVYIDVTNCAVVKLHLPGGIVSQQTLSPPSVIERGQVSDELLVQSAVDKVVDHLPAHRQEQRAARIGALIPRAKLCRWHIALASFLALVAKAVFKEISACPVVGIDDTVHRLQVDDRRVCQQGRLWAVSSPIGLYYFFSPTREGKWISELLEGFQGGIMGDAYAGHGHLLAQPDIEALFCWAHVRRKFYESEDLPRRQKMLTLIGKLYVIESGLGDKTPAERIFARSAQAKPILAEIKKRLDDWANDPSVLPKSGIGMAVNYARKLWPGLERYVTIGHAPIDNNATERAIRPIALHRKNSLFSASEAGAAAYATLLTLTQTALLHHLDPVAYLNDIILDLHYERRPLEELTPRRYALRRETTGKVSS